jgi:hypothetical protein
MNRPVIAKEGEVVTCEMGHRIATVRQSFGCTDLVDSHLFSFDIEPPLAGTRFDALRCQCGHAWCRVGPDYPVEICIEGEWR